MNAVGATLITAALARAQEKQADVESLQLTGGDINALTSALRKLEAGNEVQPL